jgi:mRNA-degrading endonuclease RelE of RelBE toxin-antitoxin system
MVVYEIKESDNFKQIFRKLDESVRTKVKKLILKIIENPEIGKPMRHNRKGTREVYVKPFRLSYAYFPGENKIIFLDLYHKDEQ